MIINKFDKQPFKGCLSFLKDNLFLVAGILITFSLCMYSILGVFGFSAFPDEFGYWSPAAAIMGYDWSAITSLGSYYSYGYSFLLVLIMFLFKGAISTYRAAVILNLLLQCIAIPMIYRILTYLFPTEKKSVRAITASVSTLYSAWVFYTQTTMAESLLFFLFVLTAYLLMSFVERPGAIKGILCAVVMVYCYFVHMRCLGIIGAGIVTIVVCLIGRRKHGFGKKAWLIPLLIVVLFAASFIIKSFVIDRLYGSTSADVISWNDYSSIPYRILKTFGNGGVRYFLQDIAGKLLYLGLASFGLGYFAIYSFAKHAFIAVKKIYSKTAEKKDYFWLYLFLATLAQFMVALVYLNGASSPYADRLDLFLHGRYIDFYLPIMIGVGICEFIRDTKKIPKCIAVFVLYLLLFVVCYRVIEENTTGFFNAHGFTMIGMSYLLPNSPVEDAAGYLIKETLLSSLLTLAVMVIIGLYSKIKVETLLFLIALIQILLSFNACNHYIFLSQSYIYGDILVGEKLREARTEHPERSIYYVYEGGVPYVELVQFEDREANINVLNFEKGFDDESFNSIVNPDNILMVHFKSDTVSALDEYYDNKWIIGHLCLYYME